jgi:hypothetical protein
MHKVRSQGAAAAKAQPVEIPQAVHHRDLNRDLDEERLKRRLQKITNFVENPTASAVTLLLAEKPLAQEVLQEVVVKEAALKWIVRVAAISTGSVRKRLWCDIEKALEDLEVIIHLLGRVDVAWPANQTLNLRDELAHIS